MANLSTIKFIIKNIETASSADEAYKNLQKTDLLNNLDKTKIDEIYATLKTAPTTDKKAHLDELKALADYTNIRISDYGFDEKAYAKLLAYTKLACIEEKNSGAEIHAYKLSVLFGDEEKALQYLNAFAHENKNCSQPVHDACLFDMPENDKWDLKAWRKIYTKYMKDSDFQKSMATSKPGEIQKRMLHTGQYVLEYEQKTEIEINTLLNQSKETQSIIQDQQRQQGALIKEAKKNPEDKITQQALEKVKSELAKNKNEGIKLKKALAKAKKNRAILLEDIAKKNLFDFALSSQYKNANKDKVAAYIYKKYGVPEKVFDEHLELKTKAKNSDKEIPRVLMQGEGDRQGWYITKLSTDDPKSAILGYITGCCQSLGSTGALCAKHGITSENSGFYVLCRGKPPKDGDTKKISPKNILAESWAWRGTDGTLVFDSVEFQSNIRQVPGNEVKIVKMFYSLGHELAEKHNVHKVNVGAGGYTPVALGYEETTPSTLKDYEGYRDSHAQREVFNKSFPFYYEIALNPHEGIKKYLAMSHKEREKYDYLAIVKIVCGLGTDEDLDSILSLMGTEAEKASYIDDNLLFHLSIQIGNVAAVDKMIALGANINLQKPGEWAPLQSALLRTKKEIAELLLEKGANVKDSDMSFAVLGGNKEIVELLLKKGVDFGPDDVNNAIYNEQKEIAELLLKIKVVQQNESLAYAALHGYKEIAKMLLQHEDNINASIRNDLNPQMIGKTAWTVAAMKGKKEFVALLLQHGADVNKPDDVGDTALMCAAAHKKAGVVEFLLQRGADVNVKNKDGDTALDLATKKGHDDIVTLIENHVQETKKTLEREEAERARQTQIEQEKQAQESAAREHHQASLREKAREGLEKTEKDDNLAVDNFIKDHIENLRKHYQNFKAPNTLWNRYIMWGHTKETKTQEKVMEISNMLTKIIDDKNLITSEKSILMYVTLQKTINDITQEKNIFPSKLISICTELQKDLSKRNWVSVDENKLKENTTKILEAYKSQSLNEMRQKIAEMPQAPIAGPISPSGKGQ